MRLSGIKFWAIALFVVSAIQVAVVSCKDDPGVENYYTQSREYAADYLRSREQYSEYLKILERARGEYELHLVDMLGTYGSYTVFAPTNEAVEKYLAERGLASVDELSIEDCDTIALNSIIEAAYFTTDFNDGQYPKSNMLEHIVSVKSYQEWDAQKQDSVLAMYINQNSQVIHADDSVSNGVVHTVSTIVGSSNDLIGTVILSDSTCLLYGQAFEVTGILDTLQDHYVDDTYGWANDKDRIDSCTWTNTKLCIPTAKHLDGSGGEYDNVAYPVKRYFNYTVFMCPDSILQEKYGVTTLLGKTDPSSLEYLAHQLYDPMYPEDADRDDLTDRKNALNRFISYHVIDRYGDYYSLTSMDNNDLQYNFNRMKYDICDWYGTLMPQSLMKFSFPSGPQVGLYINRRGVRHHADERGGYYRGAKVATPKEYKRTTTALNGMYHYIDDVVAYDRNMQEIVMNDCIRLDCTTLSPDFMTKLTDGEVARGHTWGGNKKYDSAKNTNNPSDNNNRSVGFKPGYARNFDMTANTHMHVRGRSLWFWSYEGDEVIFKGRYDFTLKLPAVPAGTYEVRMMTCVGFDTRGIVQYYIDGEPQGIPFDMRPGGETLFGWKNDTDLGDDDAITAFDKAIHNIGWMKGPKCYHCGWRSSFDAGSATMRAQNNTIRKVIGTFTTDGKSDHFLRIQQKMESENNELNFDFIELCPSSVYNNEYFSEPTW